MIYRPTSAQRRAHHESGHAILATLMAVPVEEVSIRSDGHFSAYTQLRARTPTARRNSALIAVAGAVAEAELVGRTEALRYSSSDASDLDEIGFSFADVGLWRDARSLLRLHAVEHRALVTLLAEFPVVNGPELRLITSRISKGLRQ